ncbi:hypothetical protein BurJ1DRAFT_0945 [Burkholderiales bacterium JOSHI_001]|nr:hypothetical protein BurJ1DRAFT_0945 [Burkholderiales bacterium JOSHI_001]
MALRFGPAALLPSALVSGALLSGGLLLALLLSVGDTLVQATLPAVHWGVALLAPELGLKSLVSDQERADQVLRLTVTLEHHVVLGGQVLAPDPRGLANASTPRLQGLLGPLLALWVLMSLLPVPGALGLDWRRRMLALALVLPLAALLAVADPALVLAGSVWQLLVDAAAPDSFSPLASTSRLMRGGGRFALGLAAAALALAVASALPHPRP